MSLPGNDIAWKYGCQRLEIKISLTFDILNM